MAFKGDRNDLMTFESRQAPIDRQLTQILSGLDPISDLRLTNLIQDLTNPSTQSSSSSNFLNSISSSSSSNSRIDRSAEINKLFIRIRQLLTSSSGTEENVQIGLQLANELIRCSPWNVIVSQCSEWINSALLHFKENPKESINLLDLLLGSETRQKPEFWRNVGSVASTKYGLVLIECAESLAEKNDETKDLSLILNALNNQIVLHPTSFRSNAPRIQKLCFSLIFQSQLSIIESVRLLARLPFTGKGLEDQRNLWSVTLTLFLREAKIAWESCCSAFLPSSTIKENSMFHQNDLEQSDNLTVLRIAHSRLALLLGSMPNPGILAIFLGEASVSAVQIPTEEILGLAHTILSLQPFSPTRLEHPPEVSLHAAQAALLPRAHICAISFLASLPASIWQRGYGETIRRLLSVIEKGSSTIRCAALKALSNMPITLDPHGLLLPRFTRTCLAQLTKLACQSSETSIESNGSSITTSTQGSNSRANKKRRTYEADQVLFKPLSGLVDLDEDEEEACSAAAKILSSTLYEYLITFVSPQLHDLAQSTCVLMLGVVELALKSENKSIQNQSYSKLLENLILALAKLISLSRGPMLSILSVRSAPICAQAILHPNKKIQFATESLQISLCDTFHPKLPPKLALRLHIVEQDRLEFSLQSNSRNEKMEEKQLDEIVLDEERGKSEIEIMRDVLDIERSFNEGEQSNTVATTTTNTTAVQFPRLSVNSTSNLVAAGQSDNQINPSATSNTLSPDPVKPIRRTSVPRIGSPNMNVRMESQSPDRNNGNNSSPSNMKNVIITSNDDGTGNSNVLSSPFAKTKKSFNSSKAAEIDKEESIAQPSTLIKDVEKEEVAQASMTLNETHGGGEEYDSDDSMPALDILSSDEED